MEGIMTPCNVPMVNLLLVQRVALRPQFGFGPLPTEPEPVTRPRTKTGAREFALYLGAFAAMIALGTLIGWAIR